MTTHAVALIVQDDANATVSRDELVGQLEGLHTQCFGWAMLCCGRRREDAEDVLHDTYVAVLDGRLRFRGASSVRTWLFGIIRNKARARQRREWWRRWLGLRNAARVAAAASSPTTPADDAIAAERRRVTRDALDRLSPRQREVLQLVFYQELTIEEAADVMRVSVGSARQHYARAKARMALWLGLLLAGMLVVGVVRTRAARLRVPAEVAALSSWRPLTDALLDTPGQDLLRDASPLDASIITINITGDLR